jgi:hypothetical protein
MFCRVASGLIVPHGSRSSDVRLYWPDGHETDLAESASLVARLNQAARFSMHFQNVMPPVLAAFSYLRSWLVASNRWDDTP